DGLAQHHRQLHVALLEFLRTQNGADADHLAVLVRNLYPDRTSSGNRRDNADAERCETQRDVIFKIFDSRNLDPRVRHDFVQRYSWPDRRLDALYSNLEVDKRRDNPILVLIKLLLGNLNLAWFIFAQQLERRKFIAAEIQGRIIQPLFVDKL